MQAHKCQRFVVALLTPAHCAAMVNRMRSAEMVLVYQSAACARWCSTGMVTVTELGITDKQSAPRFHLRNPARFSARRRTVHQMPCYARESITAQLVANYTDPHLRPPPPPALPPPPVASM